MQANAHPHTHDFAYIDLSKHIVQSTYMQVSTSTSIVQFVRSFTLSQPVALKRKQRQTAQSHQIDGIQPVYWILKYVPNMNKKRSCCQSRCCNTNKSQIYANTIYILNMVYCWCYEMQTAKVYNFYFVFVAVIAYWLLSFYDFPKFIEIKWYFVVVYFWWRFIRANGKNNFNTPPGNIGRKIASSKRWPNGIKCLLFEHMRWQFYRHWDENRTKITALRSKIRQSINLLRLLLPLSQFASFTTHSLHLYLCKLRTNPNSCTNGMCTDNQWTKLWFGMYDMRYRML